MKCNRNCRQGHACPTPQACEIPEDDTQINLMGALAQAILIAAGILIVAFILLAAL